MSEEKETIVVIRPGFKKVCTFVHQDKEGHDITYDSSCRAALLNHVLYWIGRNQKKGCEHWHSSGEDIYRSMAETWGVTIVRREVNALIEQNYIGEMRNPTWGVDRTKHFYFGIEQAKTLLLAFDKSDKCPLCMDLPNEIANLFGVHLINLIIANDSFITSIDRIITCICQNHHMHLTELSHANDRFIKAITKITTKITSKEREEDSVGEKEDSVEAPRIDTPAPVLSSSSQDGYTTPTEKGATDGASINDHPVPGVSAWQVAGDLDRSIHGEAEALALATPKVPFEPPGIVRLPSKSPNQSVDTDTMPAQPQIGATNGLDRHTSPDHLLRAEPGSTTATGDRAGTLHQGHLVHEVASQQTPASVQPPDHVIPPNDMIAAKQAIEVTLASEGGQATAPPVTVLSSGSAPEGAGEYEVQQNVSEPPASPSNPQAAGAPVASADSTSVSVPQAGQAQRGAREAGHQTPLFGESETPQSASQAKSDVANTQEQNKGKGKCGKKDAEITQAGPPQMPPEDAPWNDETGVQIVEAINGRRYSETTRKQEMAEIKKIRAMPYKDGKITRQQFELAWRKMISWPFWSERDIKPMIKHLRKDDKILNILETMERESKPKSAMNGNGAHPPVSVSGRRRLDLDDDPPISTRYTTRSIPHA